MPSSQWFPPKLILFKLLSKYFLPFFSKSLIIGSFSLILSQRNPIGSLLQQRDQVMLAFASLILNLFIITERHVPCKNVLRFFLSICLKSLIVTVIISIVSNCTLFLLKHKVLLGPHVSPELSENTKIGLRAKLLSEALTCCVRLVS